MDGVTRTLDAGKTLCRVGESGTGKTVPALSSFAQTGVSEPLDGLEMTSRRDKVYDEVFDHVA